MNYALRKFSFFIGFGLLAVSMYWSQDGFNFNVAGQSGYQNMAVLIGWFLAISVTCIQFVFSSNYKELNASLILFGVLAYAYSIYTNYQGILHFQGDAKNNIGAIVLGIVMDGIPEPLIAWSLYESLSGDWIGNIIRVVFSAPDKTMSKNASFQKTTTMEEKPKHFQGNRPNFPKKEDQNSENLHSVKTHFAGRR